jgi:hypothetical protein
MKYVFGVRTSRKFKALRTEEDNIKTGLQDTLYEVGGWDGCMKLTQDLVECWTVIT